MSVYVENEKELGKALKNDEDSIEISVDLERKVLKIKATRGAAWIVAVGAITVAVVATLAAPATGGASSLVSVAAAPAAVSILGASTTIAAINIAVAAGGTKALNKLREYKIVKNNGKTILIKK